MTKRRWLFITALALGALVVTAGAVVARGPGSPSRAPLAQSALGTGFTYQGRLDEGGIPANGSFDFEFRLYDDSDVGAAQVGGIVALEDFAVANGVFTTRLDFGDGVFNGDARWLEVAVRPGASTVAHTIMLPRQPITPVPYALFAANAPSKGLSIVTNRAFVWDRSDPFNPTSSLVDTDDGSTIATFPGRGFIISCDGTRALVEDSQTLTYSLLDTKNGGILSVYQPPDGATTTFSVRSTFSCMQSSQIGRLLTGLLVVDNRGLILWNTGARLIDLDTGAAIASYEHSIVGQFDCTGSRLFLLNDTDPQALLVDSVSGGILASYSAGEGGLIGLCR